jgi:uncharacterized coiled-coil DUF342 family protein
MNPQYQSLRAQADQLFRHFNDTVGDKNAGAGIAQEIRAIVKEIEMSKNPHSIEASVKRVTNELKQMRLSGSAIMNYQHLDELCVGLDDLRKQVQALSNY